MYTFAKRIKAIAEAKAKNPLILDKKTGGVTAASKKKQAEAVAKAAKTPAQKVEKSAFNVMEQSKEMAKNAKGKKG